MCVGIPTGPSVASGSPIFFEQSSPSVVLRSQWERGSCIRPAQPGRFLPGAGHKKEQRLGRRASLRMALLRVPLTAPTSSSSPPTNGQNPSPKCTFRVALTMKNLQRTRMPHPENRPLDRFSSSQSAGPSLYPSSFHLFPHPPSPRPPFPLRVLTSARVSTDRGCRGGVPRSQPLYFNNESECCPGGGGGRNEGERPRPCHSFIGSLSVLIYMKTVGLDDPRTMGGAEVGGAQMPLSAGPAARLSL